ncbi:MAG: tetratricopeptide repeat protein, partial [Candidatus Krumholzibacteria bacterium]|nr:tetratricopeptide repeat protein [Candidatus Krumholzibacteria bacterium]
MAQFLGEEPSADELEDRALALFVDYAPAIALYEAILAEDPDFPHLDAVLFNLGMILSDDGQPTAAGYLARLVREYPDSPDCQEAWLRMGNDRFDREDFAGCVSLFEQAAAGQDPSFTAIALYKLGWAHFEEDRFDNSADAFRRLMDLYAAHEDLAEDMDLGDEAEEYLVHSLARSGGADAFRTYFDNLGGRVYESRVLISLGYMMRRVSLYEEAVECDELWLDPYPLHPQALAVAERLIDTYRSWNKPDAAREVKLAQAERFLPDSQWFRANKDDAAQAAGLRFAQSAYRETAAHQHFRARQNDDAASWRSALTNYEHYLMYWPDADDAPRIHFLAGETASRLSGFSSAIAHYTMAAKSDSS